TEPRIERLARFVAEVAAAQPMIEVRAAEPAREAREQIELFECRGRRGNRTDLLSAVVLDDTRETFRRRRERRLPLHFLPHAILPHERAHEAVFAVDALIAEAVAVGDPRFVNVLVR